ncbi:MAG: hypothetical protein J6M01_04370 [Prevotella sp.]|nr:hypothetical protein [Prevotella sp.]
MKKLFSMAALALVGATFTGCSSSDDNIIDQPQQPEVIKSNVVTMTTTVGLDGGGDATRALAADGKKTFAAGETMALVYKNTGGSTVKVVSTALTDADITDGGKSATFTFELTDPDKAQEVTYIYPAAMANADGTVNYSALNSQNGTLASLAANLDYCTKSGAWDGDNLPTLTLENQLAILAVTLKNEDGSSEITGSTTKLTLSDGTNTYNVNRSAADGPIYVAIRPTTEATISIQAINGSQGYYKTLTTTKSYAANNGYSVSWRMTQGANLSLLTAAYTAQNGDKLTGTLGSNVKISIADGATVTLKDVNINGSGTWTSGNYAGITCAGDATITLEGTNTVKGFYEKYPGIFVSSGKTLIINGTGELNASSNGSYDTGSSGAGIGGGYEMNCGNIEIQSGIVTATGNKRCAGIGGGYNASCGNITISGGTVNATGGQYGAGIGGGRRFSANVSCGNITISGGTITATGGEDAAGIGGGRGNNNIYKSSCGTITITSGVTSVTATKGNSNAQSIGAGRYGTCGAVTIEDSSKVTQN